MAAIFSNKKAQFFNEIELMYRPEKFEAYARAVRYIPKIEGEGMTRRNRTHNIELINNTIFIENNNSKYTEYKFDSNEDAIKFWNENIGTEVKVQA